jgi:hypothetical protein
MVQSMQRIFGAQDPRTVQMQTSVQGADFDPKPTPQSYKPTYDLFEGPGGEQKYIRQGAEIAPGFRKSGGAGRGGTGSAFVQGMRYLQGELGMSEQEALASLNAAKTDMGKRNELITKLAASYADRYGERSFAIATQQIDEMMQETENLNQQRFGGSAPAGGDDPLGLMGTVRMNETMGY